VPRGTGKGGCCLGVKAALRAGSDCFTKHHAGQTRAEHNTHFASRGRNRLKIDQGLPHRFVDRALPGRRVDKPLKAFASAKPITARLLPLTVSGDHRNVEPNHWTNIAISFSIDAQNLDDLPSGGNTAGQLPPPTALPPPHS